ncbi:MAG: hypothetical protein WCE77_09555 [Priestia megaterium]
MDKEQVIKIYPHVLERRRKRSPNHFFAGLKGKRSTVKSIKCLYNKKLAVPLFSPQHRRLTFERF